MIVNLKGNTNDFYQRTDTLVRYYDDIKRYPLLTPEEEKELFFLYKEGNNDEKRMALETLTNSNLRFVVSMARKYGTNDNILDLISEGNEGLLQAIDTFDLSMGAKFSTHAVWYIRRAINNYLIRHDKIVKKSNVSRTYHVISQATNKFIQREQRNPSSQELIDMLQKEYNVNIKDVTDVLETKFISIDDMANKEDGNANSGDIMLYKRSSATSNTFEKEVQREFDGRLVANLLHMLTPREQEIIKYLFGIGYERAFELKEVSDMMNLTTERVRQIKHSALAKLKKSFSYAMKCVK